MTNILSREVLEAIWARQFELAGKSPSMWKLSARNLMRAADLAFDQAEAAFQRSFNALVERAQNGSTGTYILSQEETEDSLDRDLFSVYGLLAGYAIENLAKGIIIGREPDLITKKGKFQGRLKNHDLKTLTKEALGSLNPEEKDVLRILGVHVSWIGRYPIPLAWEAKKSWIDSEGNEVDPNQTRIHQKRELIMALFKRLVETLNEEQIARNVMSPEDRPQN